MLQLPGPRHGGLIQPFPFSSRARAQLGPTVTAPVSILCWHILVPAENSDPGSHHPWVVSPAAWWGEVSPKIPLPTPLGPSPAPPAPPTAPKPEQEWDICSQRHCWNLSSDSMARTAPAGAGNKSPLSCPVLQVFQDYINPCVLCPPRQALCAGQEAAALFGVIYVRGFGVIRAQEGTEQHGNGFGLKCNYKLGNWWFPKAHEPLWT